MFRFSQLILAGFLMIVSCQAASADNNSPEGLWEPQNKQSRYEISYCGNNYALCALVKWIDPAYLNDRNKKFLNTYLFSQIPMRGRGKWRGTINFEGRKINGTVKHIASDKLSVRACLLFLCETVTLTRVSQ